MSLLTFVHEEKSAMILTDTLATTPKGETLMFLSKAWAIPHMNMAIANTGVGTLGDRWNAYLHSSLLAKDVEMVNEFAPQQLRLIWSELLAEHDIVEAPTATMYHFGFSEDSDQLVRYVYRSTESFEPERHEEPGFAIKPGLEGEFDPPKDVEEWVILAERVRAEQDARPASERIYIGGELYLLILENWQSRTVRVHRFQDYEQVWLDMNDRLQRENNAA